MFLLDRAMEIVRENTGARASSLRNQDFHRLESKRDTRCSFLSRFLCSLTVVIEYSKEKLDFLSITASNDRLQSFDQLFQCQ